MPGGMRPGRRGSGRTRSGAGGRGPPATISVKLTVAPATGLAGEKMKSAVRRAGTTTTVWVAIAVWPSKLVAVRMTSSEPAAAYAWVGEDSIEDVRSPKSQLRPYGGVPPETISVKLTVAPARGLAGEKMKSAVRRAGTTTTVWVAIAVWPSKLVAV